MQNYHERAYDAQREWKLSVLAVLGWRAASESYSFTSAVCGRPYFACVQCLENENVQVIHIEQTPRDGGVTADRVGMQGSSEHTWNRSSNWQYTGAPVGRTKRGPTASAGGSVREFVGA